MLVSQCSSDDPTVRALTPSMGLRQRLRRRLRRRQISRSIARYRLSRPYDGFSDDRTQHANDLLNQLHTCDVVNLHWIVEFVDYQAFFSTVPRRTPVVWSVYDMNAFTGGCHYDNGCGKFRQRCGSCPQLGSQDGHDLSNQIWERKRRAFELISPDRLHIVTTSRWLATEIKASSLLRSRPLTVIPQGIDVEVFAPRGWKFARDVLGIPLDAKVVLFVAASTGNQRKGFHLLAQALKDLGDLANVFFISVGGGKPVIDAQIPYLHIGKIDNDRFLSVIYSAADVFVVPSLQDNLPLTALEALACGTPVVGFDVGGIPEMVRPGVSGLLAPAYDVTGLRDAIVALLQDAIREEMRENCRRIATEEYSISLAAQRYADLYNNILDDDHQHGSGS